VGAVKQMVARWWGDGGGQIVRPGSLDQDGGRADREREQDQAAEARR
jgi:hypothetical protein